MEEKSKIVYSIISKLYMLSFPRLYVTIFLVKQDLSIEMGKHHLECQYNVEVEEDFLIEFLCDDDPLQKDGANPW